MFYTKLMKHRYPLDEIEEAFRTVADKTTGALKVHVVQDTSAKNLGGA
ncbi:MAG: hypothetical protein VYA69_15815 [Gemmatimonadota bacterium]|nr:hypothetical protein [Gemmatimonadota bacterium]